ncbi:MAG: hypothetical protein NXI24_24615 [bacterium]|nr:hypothetical protein [bacterium]
MRLTSYIQSGIALIFALALHCHSPEAAREAHLRDCPLVWVTDIGLCLTRASSELARYEDAREICAARGLSIPQPAEIENATGTHAVLDRELAPYWGAGGYLIRFDQQPDRALRESKSVRARFVCVAYMPVLSPGNPFPFQPGLYELMEDPDGACRRSGLGCSQEALD